MIDDGDPLSGNEEGQESIEEDLDGMATAQEEEAEALASLATANRTLRDIGDKQYIRATGATRSSQQKAGAAMRHLQRSTLGLTVSREARENLARRREKRQLTQRTANLQWLCTQKRAYSHEEPWKQEEL